MSSICTVTTSGARWLASGFLCSKPVPWINPKNHQGQQFRRIRSHRRRGHDTDRPWGASQRRSQGVAAASTSYCTGGFHAHFYAREMYATLERRDGELVGLRSRVPYVYTDVKAKGHSLRPRDDPAFNRGVDAGWLADEHGIDIRFAAGDRIHTTCVYNTTSESKDVPFGLSTAGEMCGALAARESFERLCGASIEAFAGIGYAATPRARQ